MCRGNVIDRLKFLVDYGILCIIEMMLLPTDIETIGDPGEIVRLQTRVFNTFIDPLAGAITLLAHGECLNPLNLYADDVVLLAPSVEHMQMLLD